jgi:hypothetical protein
MFDNTLINFLHLIRINNDAKIMERTFEHNAILNAKFCIP